MQLLPPAVHTFYRFKPPAPPGQVKSLQREPTHGAVPPTRRGQAAVCGVGVDSDAQPSHCSPRLPSWRERTSEEILASLSPSTSRSVASGLSSFRSSTLTLCDLESSLRTKKHGSRKTRAGFLAPAGAPQETGYERGSRIRLDKERREGRLESSASKATSDDGSSLDGSGSMVARRAVIPADPSFDRQPSSRGLGPDKTCRARPSSKTSALTRPMRPEKRQDASAAEEKLEFWPPSEIEYRKDAGRRVLNKTPVVAGQETDRRAAEIALSGSHGSMSRSARGTALNDVSLKREPQACFRVPELPCSTRHSPGAAAEQGLSRGNSARVPSRLSVPKMYPPKIHSVSTPFGSHRESTELISS